MSIFVDETPKEVVITFEGKEYRFKVKEPTWSQMNKAINLASGLKKDGTMKFDIDVYYREMLTSIIVESPPEIPINQITLVSITPEFGEELIKLVPQPYGGESVDATFRERSA